MIIAVNKFIKDVRRNCVRIYLAAIYTFDSLFFDAFKFFFIQAGVGDPSVHDRGRLRPGRQAAPVVHARRRARGLPPAHGARVRLRPRPGTGPVPRCRSVGQLDVRGALCARVGPQGR